MQLPVQSQSTIYAEPWEAGAGADELAAVARSADANGFLYIAVCDHIAIPKPLDETMNTSWWDTTTTLGYLAALTERVHLMSHVYVLPYRHPLVAAKAFLTLDAVSRGRAILGVGAGHVEKEFELLGVDFLRRGPLLDEAIDVVRAAFVDEYPVADGPTWPVSGAGLRPRPVQPGGPPIWVGGSSPAALRRAADRGDGWLPQGPPKLGMRKGIEYLRSRRAEAGKADEPFVIGANSVVHIGQPSWDVGQWCLTGPAEQVAEKLRKLAGIGVDQVQVRFRARTLGELLDQMDRFGHDVAPLLKH
ncbi:MAG: TIGR03619 family F420-dependent LLM class oxidoreductase [Actinobacteria bacterium]|nr:TIGR03619 family F420-dependent LLM class oxidoreductase [Actinomycetota bacterium]